MFQAAIFYAILTGCVGTQVKEDPGKFSCLMKCHDCPLCEMECRLQEMGKDQTEITVTQ